MVKGRRGGTSKFQKSQKVPKRKKVSKPARKSFRVQIDLRTLRDVKDAGHGPTPERVGAAMRRALRSLHARMAKVDSAATQEAYFALGLVRAISPQMKGRDWQKQDAWVGATDYMTALANEWPEVMAGPNKVKHYRAAVLSVRADGFFLRPNGKHAKGSRKKRGRK